MFSDETKDFIVRLIKEKPNYLTNKFCSLQNLAGDNQICLRANNGTPPNTSSCSSCCFFTKFTNIQEYAKKIVSCLATSANKRNFVFDRNISLAISLISNLLDGISNQFYLTYKNRQFDKSMLSNASYKDIVDFLVFLKDIK